jgi:hypothetical protein
MNPKNKWKPYECFTNEVMEEINNLFKKENAPWVNSPVFKPEYIKEFCYMGDWGFVYYLENGSISACFDSPKIQNICNDISKPIKFEALGACCSPHCVCCNIQALGLIPEFDNCLPTYYTWYKNASFTNDYFRQTLDIKFSEVNKTYSKAKKQFIRLKRRFSQDYRQVLKNVR